jgi:hypothetical protein
MTFCKAKLNEFIYSIPFEIALNVITFIYFVIFPIYRSAMNDSDRPPFIMYYVLYMYAAVSAFTLFIYAPFSNQFQARADRYRNGAGDVE